MLSAEIPTQQYHSNVTCGSYKCYSFVPTIAFLPVTCHNIYMHALYLVFWQNVTNEQDMKRWKVKSTEYNPYIFPAAL